ncbi:glycosyltransferase [Candidatus Moduliflexus flocculans]|uniref:Glycosyltransferase n=1 Tax=Candidatus Moduliflexus flocculans TaxID=1499966 RepID=A0A081BLZ6_9BACT|nr:glycosyltransferase [Candidatus Moduliflexus flocculans]
MNIGYIEHFSGIGGGQRMLEILLDGLQGTEFVPYVSCPGQGEFVDLLRSKNISVEFHKLIQPSRKNPFLLIDAFREWSSFIRPHRFALIHVNHLHGGRSVMPAAFWHKTPVVCHVHFPLEEAYCRWVFNFLPKPAGFIFCSHELQQDSGAHLKKYYPHARQWVVHNGVDVSRFVPSQTSNDISRIGIIANLQKRKGHEDFLEMAARLTRQGKSAIYDIIGGDVYGETRQEALLDYARQLGISDRVIFHGQMADVRPVLSQLDILVCTSYQEAFPVSILEAMACGKPVVSTNINGIPEAIDEGQTGFLVPPHAPEALANAVTILLDHPELRNEMGLNGRRRVEQYFSCDAYTAGIIHIYRELLKCT